tara:strand:- start:463 stop:720 length:258 start_codon:yes stop_codon:yes gene_type:complete
MKLTDRDNTDYGKLQDIISEVYEECGHDDFIHGNSVVDLTDDVLHIINKNPDYRYLRLFNNNEIEKEIESFKDDMEEINRLKREG